MSNPEFSHLESDFPSINNNLPPSPIFDTLGLMTTTAPAPSPQPDCSAKVILQNIDAAQSLMAAVENDACTGCRHPCTCHVDPQGRTTLPQDLAQDPPLVLTGQGDYERNHRIPLHWPFTLAETLIGTVVLIGVFFAAAALFNMLD